MNAAEYAAKKAAGLCTGYRSCKLPPLPGKTRCQGCADRLARAKRAAVERRKASGLCVTVGCPNPANPYRCDSCKAKNIAAKRRWLERHPGANTEHTRAFRARREALGLCIQCSQPAVAGGRCERHRRIQNERLAARKIARGGKPSTARCSSCGRPGHRWSTCPGDTVSIDHFATARREWA